MRDLGHRYGAPAFVPLIDDERRQVVAAHRALENPHERGVAGERFVLAIDALHLKRDLLDEGTVSPRLAGELRSAALRDLDGLAGLWPALEAHLVGLARTAAAARRLLSPRWRQAVHDVDADEVNDALESLRQLLDTARAQLQRPLPEPRPLRVSLRVLAALRESSLTAERGAIVEVDGPTAVRLLETGATRLRSRDQEHPGDFPDAPDAASGPGTIAAARARELPQRRREEEAVR